MSEHHHGFDYMPDQPTATCNCGLERGNPYAYIPPKSFYYFLCGKCGESRITYSQIESTTIAALHKTCTIGTSTGLHMSLPVRKPWWRKLLNRLLRQI